MSEKRVAIDIASGGPAAARQASRRILIVEDNHFVARQCERVLTDAGWEVVDIATTADDAVGVALKRRPQIVLMDIYLIGKRDGIDAAIEILERCGIHSIFASAPADSVTKARAEATHPLAWLPKPFSDKKLLATVESAVVNVDASLEWAAHPSLMLKCGARQEKTTNIRPDKPTPCCAEVEFPDILAAIAALKNPAPALATLALAEVWRALVTGEGPSVRGRGHFSRTIDAADAALCEHILVAAGGEAGAPVDSMRKSSTRRTLQRVFRIGAMKRSTAVRQRRAILLITGHLCLNRNTSWKRRSLQPWLFQRLRRSQPTDLHPSPVTLGPRPWP